MYKPLVLIFIPLLFGICSCKTKKPKEKVKQKTSFTLPFEVDENSFMMKMQSEALQEPYIGIFTSSGKEDNLFPIKSSGVSTKPIIDAGINFINSLSNEQVKKTIFQIQEEEWRKWSNVDHGIFERKGISIKEMNKDQRILAFKLLH